MADALRSGRSVRKGMRVQISPSAVSNLKQVEDEELAPVAQFGLERSPAEAEVAGSSPTRRATIMVTHFPILSTGGRSACLSHGNMVIM